ncbi:MAG: DnaJ domain-containing protein [Cytophagaceae bacterium]
MKFNFYQILGVSQTASQAEIKSAYKKLAVKYHPDKNLGNKFAEEHFKKVNEAYQVLSDSVKKNIYDAKLIYGTQRSSSNTSGVNSNTRPKARKKRPTAYSTKKNNPVVKKKYVFFSLAFFSIIIGLTVLFYNYMNKYSSDKYYLEALELNQKGQYLAAFEKYSLSIELNDVNPAPYFKRGLLRNTLFSDPGGSAYDFSRYITLSENPEAEAYYQRSLAFVQMRKYDQAMNDLIRYTDVHTHNDSAYYIMGEIFLYHSGKINNAISMYTKSIQLNAGDNAYFGRGHAYLQLAQYDSARADFIKVTELNPMNKESYYYLGFSYLGSKDTLNACSSWETALKKGMEDAEDPIKKVCIRSSE